MYDRLRAHYGPQRWWPAETRFEVIVGALLMAQTAWRNVEASLENLKAAGMLDPREIAAAPMPRLRTLVRPAGLYRQKPRRLKRFCEHLVRTADGDLDRFFDRDLAVVRSELLGLDGIGPETADSILLYAARFPTFVVDAYTVRIGRRLGLFATDSYDGVQTYFESRVPANVDAYREYHALLVALAKDVCRPVPRCGVCPLRDMCRHGRRTERLRASKTRTKATRYP